VPAAPAGLQPPPPNWRTRLEQQARTIMAHTDTTVGTEATRIQTPPKYAFGVKVDLQGPAPGGDVHGNGSASRSGGSRATFGRADWTPPANVAVPPLISGSGSGGGGEGVDPTLSGGASPGTSAKDEPRSPSGIGGVASGGSTSGSFVTTPYGPVLAPGGTIGPRASTPAAQTRSRTPTGHTSTSQVGPTGAGTASGTVSRAGTPGAMPMAPMVPPMGGRAGAGTSGRSLAGRPGHGRRGNRSHTNPDDPWAVAEGGPAVLEPLPEPTEHDPGPGVIGIDR
jgi:hypothetical protein